VPSHEIGVVSSPAAAAALLPEWEALFAAAGCSDPFAQPRWQLTWARHFVRPGELVLLTARSAGELVGVAPFYRRALRLGTGRDAPPAVTVLGLLGAGRRPHLTELPAVLTRPDCSRSVLRELFRHLEREQPWDWLEVTLAPEQGWFEPHWLPAATNGARAGAEPSVALHKATRACVVLPLADTWDETARGLKHNVRESIRRGVNRLRRDGHAWRVAWGGEDVSLSAALDTVVALEGARAGLDGRPHHAARFDDGADRRFLGDVAGQLAARGAVVPCVLEVDGRPAAARLVLRANGTVYFFASGSDPAWWDQGVPTTLMVECLKRAIAGGDRRANLSTGIDVSKLRWSEDLALWQDFVVVRGRTRSRLAFGVWWQLRAAGLLGRERALRGYR